MDSDDDYIVQDFSDEGGIDSSDDDEMAMQVYNSGIQSTAVQGGNRKMIDDFKAAMRDELEARAADAQTAGEFEIPGFSSNKTPSKQDEEYESDLEEEEDGEELKLNMPTSNDDIFYDPDMDAKDEEWVHGQRNKYQPKNKSTTSKLKPLPNSDARLNCPACFTSLCHDCQQYVSISVNCFIDLFQIPLCFSNRHSTYKSQYRAVFTFNCSVDKSTKLKYPVQSQKGKNNKLKKPESEELTEDDEVYFPVKCSVCDTQVAVLDNEEVFHFFNVVTSH